MFSTKYQSLKRLIARVLSRNKGDVEVLSIGAKPVKTIRFIEGDVKNRKLMERQGSKRVTLPWYKQNFTHVQVTKMVDPDTKEFAGIMIKFKDEGEKVV